MSNEKIQEMAQEDLSGEKAVIRAEAFREVAEWLERRRTLIISGLNRHEEFLICDSDIEALKSGKLPIEVPANHQ